MSITLNKIVKPNRVSLVLICIFFQCCVHVYAVKKDTLIYNFGNIDVSTKFIEHRFFIINEEEKPLIIKRVKLHCPCTEANWEKRPIPYKDSGFIDILYRNNSKGFFEKEIKVETNYSDIILIIKGLSKKCETKK